MKKMRIFVAMITLGVLISMQFTQNVAAATQKSSFDNSKVYAKENVSVIEVSSVIFEYMDDPYTEESYSDPVVSMQYHGSMSGGSGMVSRENYNFYWRDVKTDKVLADTDIFEKGKEYSLSLELPCEFDQRSSFGGESHRYVYEKDFHGEVGGVAFTDKDYVVEGDKIIIKDIYSRICIDRPEDKIRIHSIDFRNINTKLYEGQDTNTLRVWKGYDETPVYINGEQKVEEGSVLDKNLHWSLFWVKLDYNAAQDWFTLAPPSDSSTYWWKLDFQKVEPNTYYGLVMILRWEQHENGPEIAVDADMLQGSNFKFVPMVNSAGIVQNCDSTFFGDIWGGLDDENDPNSMFTGYNLMAGCFSITKSLPADANNASPAKPTKPNKVSTPKVAKIKAVKVTAGRNKLNLRWKKASGISGYQLQVSPKKTFKGARKITVKKSAKAYTVKKLKSRKTYFVRIRAYKKYMSEGKKKQAYGKWVTVKAKTTSKK
jgi:hypothetical protein